MHLAVSLSVSSVSLSYPFLLFIFPLNITMLVALLSTLIYLGNVLAIFLFISGLSCPRYGLASFNLNRLRPIIPGFPYNSLLPVSCGDIGFEKKHVNYRDPDNLDRLDNSLVNHLTPYQDKTSNRDRT